MKQKNQQLLIFYWMALFVDCYFIYSGQHDYRLFSKGILMLLLIFYFYSNVSSKYHTRSKILVCLALLLAWIGDILLLFPKEIDFSLGIIFFLAMHFVYCMYFLRIKPFNLKAANKLIFVILAIAVFDIAFIKLMSPYLGNYKIPVMIYIVVISAMLLFACNVFLSKRVSTLATNFFIPGAILFIVSDGLLAYNKFYVQEEVVYMPVMLTYGYAQQLLGLGFIQHLKYNG